MDLDLAAVTVGAALQVLTNNSWEDATVVALVDGKIDIQFPDGEIMHSLVPCTWEMPRLLPRKDDSEEQLVGIAFPILESLIANPTVHTEEKFNVQHDAMVAEPDEKKIIVQPNVFPRDEEVSMLTQPFQQDVNSKHIDGVVAEFSEPAGVGGARVFEVSTVLTKGANVQARISSIESSVYGAGCSVASLPGRWASLGVLGTSTPER